MVIARNPNSVNRASSFAERLHLGFAVIHGEEKVEDSDRDDGRASPPPSLEASSSDLMLRVTTMHVHDLPGRIF